MADKSKKDTKNTTSKFKFVRLAKDNAFWRDPKSGFGLYAIKDAEKSFANISTIPKEALGTVDKAVKAGLLEYTKDPEKKQSNLSQRTSTPLVTDMHRSTLQWTDEDVTDRMKKSPSFSGANLDVTSDDPVEKKAFKVLAAAPKAVITKIDSIVSALDTKESTQFIETCLKVEKNGNNPAMQSRTQIIDYLRGILVDLGVSTGISNVITEEPLVSDSKKEVPLKINL